LRSLLVWEKSHELVLKVYEITKDFPNEELFGITSQMRRAAISIPCNIIEGKARGSIKDFKRFLLISRGSLEELKYLIVLAKDLNFINKEIFDELQEMTKEVGKLLAGLIKSIK